MRIGITYNLKPETSDIEIDEQFCEFDKQETIDAIANVIKELNFEAIPLGFGMEFIKGLLANNIDFIFNIAEGYVGRTRESQVPSICEMLNIPYTFSDSLTLGITLEKSIAKRIIQKYNVPTSDFEVVDNLNSLGNIRIDYPLFIKPVMEGSSKGIHNFSVVNNVAELKDTVNYIISKFKQPAIIEKYLPGREFTVGVLGNEKPYLLGIMEVEYQNSNEIYSIENKRNYKKYINYKLIDNSSSNGLYKEIKDIALNSYKILNCKDAARVDIRCDENSKPYFLEINPLPGLNPEDSDLSIMARLKGITYKELISKIIREAFKRYKIRPF